jgi:hypothetical protein
LQELLEAKMTEALGAAKAERTPARLGYRAGYYPRTLVTRVGKLELRVPQDRHGRFSTALFERYRRSEKALVAALAEMYVQGVSTPRSRRSPRAWLPAPTSVVGAERRAVRPQLLGLSDQRDQRQARRGAGAVRAPAAGRCVSVSDPGCPL